jgi:hypothetical protein
MRYGKARRDLLDALSEYSGDSSVEDVLHDFLAYVCKPVATRVYYLKAGMRLIVPSAPFQSERTNPRLFYLHEDADAGVAVPSVALLRVGITLRVKTIAYSFSHGEAGLGLNLQQNSAG